MTNHSTTLNYRSYILIGVKTFVARRVVVGLVPLALTACHHKWLEYEGPANLTVRFDWTAVPDARPAEMALTVFTGGGQPVQIAFQNRSGGDVSLSGPRRFAFVGHNTDTEALFTRGTDWCSFEVYSQRTTLSSVSRIFTRSNQVPRANGTYDEDVIFQPDELWTSATDGVFLHAGTHQTITLPMEVATCEYHFVINNVENLSYATSLVATLSGMSGSWLPAIHACSDTYCIIPFELTGSGSTLEGTVRTFGHCPDHVSGLHMLVIYAVMKDGSKVYFTTDITSVMHDTDHTTDGTGTGNTDIPIVIDNLPLPKPITNGSGLQPDVEEWTEISILVPMD